MFTVNQTPPPILSRNRGNAYTSVIRAVTVSAFSMTLVSRFDNPGQYVLFQFGRSGTRLLSVSFVRCLCPLEAVFVFIPYIEIMGLRLVENVQPLQDVAGHSDWCCERARKPRVRVPASLIIRSGIMGQSLTLLKPYFPQL